MLNSSLCTACPSAFPCPWVHDSSLSRLNHCRLLSSKAPWSITSSLPCSGLRPAPQALFLPCFSLLFGIPLRLKPSYGPGCSLEFSLCECEMASLQHPLTSRGASGPLSNENFLKKPPSAAPTSGMSLSLNAASNITDSPASTDSEAP